MSNLSVNGRKIKRLRMHASTHVEGIGNVGPLVDCNIAKVGSVKIELTKTDNGVLGGCKTLKDGYVEFFIPDTNIVSMDLKLEANSKTAV